MNVRILYLLSSFMSSFLAFLVPIIPIYAPHLGASQFMLGLIGGVGALSYKIFCTFLANVRQRFGGLSIAIGFSSFGAFCLLLSSITFPELSPLLMLLQGLSTSFFWPPMEELVKGASGQFGSEMYSSNYSFSWSFGAVVGSLMSGFALELFKLQVTFIIISILSFTLAIVSICFIRENKVYDRTGFGSSVRFIFLEFKWV